MATLASALLLAVAGVFAPHYRLVGHHGMATDGRYTVLWSVRRGEVGTFIDELTGSRRRVMLPAHCRSGGRVSPILGDSTLLADCGPGIVALYSPASDGWRVVAAAPTCRNCVPLAVGAHWIEYDEQSTRRGDRFIFQNVATGEVHGDPTSATTLPDLDSPMLAQPVCPSLRVPRRGTLTFDGRFAVAVGATGTFIEKCGTHLRVPVPSEDVAASPHSLVWSTTPTDPVSGVFLPSLRRFTIAPPPGHSYVVDVELSVRRLYVTVATGAGGADVWTAPAPVAKRSR